MNHERRSRREALETLETESFGQAHRPDTPEEALASIYAEWLRAEARLIEDWRTFEALHVPEGMEYHMLSPSVRIEIEKTYGHPEESLGSLAEVAEYALSEWPEHPIADHATLALVRAQTPAGRRGEWDGEVTADLLELIHTPTIKEQAALVATRFDNDPSNPVPATLLDAVAHTPTTSAANALRIDTWGLNRAMFNEDWTRAATWAQRLRDSHTEACTEDASPLLNCAGRAYELRDASARLIAISALPATTWKDAISAAAWRCHLEEPHVGTSKSDIYWDGSEWHFSEWDTTTATTTCLSRTTTTPITPEHPIRVRLILESP